MGMIRNLRLAARAASEYDGGTRDKNREPLDGDWILQQLSELQVFTWGYDFEPADILRLGPMAQDFHRRFGFGTTDERIPIESAIGVLMVCVQVLARRVGAAETELANLRSADEHHSAEHRMTDVVPD